MDQFSLFGSKAPDSFNNSQETFVCQRAVKVGRKIILPGEKLVVISRQFDFFLGVTVLQLFHSESSACLESMESFIHKYFYSLTTKGETHEQEASDK